MNLKALILCLSASAIFCVLANPIQVAQWEDKEDAFHIVANGDGCEVDVLVKTDGALSIRRISGKFQKSSEEDGTFTVKIFDNSREEEFVLYLDPVYKTVRGDLPEIRANDTATKKSTDQEKNEDQLDEDEEKDDATDTGADAENSEAKDKEDANNQESKETSSAPSTLPGITADKSKIHEDQSNVHEPSNTVLLSSGLLSTFLFIACQ